MEPNLSPPRVELRGIVKSYGPMTALSGIDFRVHGGEVVCLLGDNGAGKSTLVRILSGVHRPDVGTMLVENRETIFTSPRDAIKNGIATVYQDLPMIPLMTVARNFFLGAEPKKGLF